MNTARQWLIGFPAVVVAFLLLAISLPFLRASDLSRWVAERNGWAE